MFQTRTTRTTENSHLVASRARAEREVEILSASLRQAAVTVEKQALEIARLKARLGEAA